MKIRLARVEDIQQILILFKELDSKHIENCKDIKPVITDERYNMLFKNVFKENSNFLLTVTEEGNLVVGFALAKIILITNNFIFKDLSIGEVLYVAVDKNFKRKGVGKKIMIDIEERLKMKGVNKLELRVFSFNDETIPEKVGYKIKYTVYEKY